MRTPLVVVALLALLASPSYAAASSTGEVASEPSTSGRIVWTNRAADGRESLVIANADGTGQRALTHAGKGEHHLDAQFSPNGRWIAYEAGDEDGFEVRLVRRNGTQDHRLPVGCKDPCLGIGTPTWISNKRLFFVKAKGPIVDDNAAEALEWSVDIDGSDPFRMSDKRRRREVRGQPGAGLTRRVLRHLDASATLRRQVHDHAGRRRRRRPGADPAVGPGRRGVRPLARHQWADPGPGPLRGLRPRRPGRDVRRPGHRAVALQRREAVPQEDRLADGQQGVGSSQRQPALVARRPRLRLHRPREHRHRGRPDLDDGVRHRRARSAREISTSQRFDYRPDWGRD